jgi:hypothetical protein
LLDDRHVHGEPPRSAQCPTDKVSADLRIGADAVGESRSSIARRHGSSERLDTPHSASPEPEQPAGDDSAWLSAATQERTQTQPLSQQPLSQRNSGCSHTASGGEAARAALMFGIERGCDTRAGAVRPSSRDCGRVFTVIQPQRPRCPQCSRRPASSTESSAVGSPCRRRPRTRRLYWCRLR